MLPEAPARQAPLVAGATLCGGRLSVLRRLGEGGMGIVYEAFDRERNSRVALKTLSRLDPGGVYQLKNEFRLLADVRHPNLVRLHELFREEEQWFFTMDLVEGKAFDEWVRPSLEVDAGDSRTRALDEVRLRAAFPQLLAAARAIHEAGKVHRDLKPSNVLVTDQGTVVVLDFGLAVAKEIGGVGQTITEIRLAGTPAYMAPEQVAGDVATQASDVYAIGSMLFESLTGRLPFTGHPRQMISAKLHDEAPRARTVSPTAPIDLDALCAALLARDPSSRPHVESLCLQFPLSERYEASSAVGSGRVAASALLGRDDELRALRDAYGATLTGTPVTVLVSGESGAGKSMLVETFLAELRAQGHAIVLAGRCYERENVPYKGFDALIDELSRYLRKLPDGDAALLLPRQVHALSRLFPVLERVAAVAQAPRHEIRDPHELQSLGFAALRELILALRERRPVVLYIDDLQWIDRDTLVLLEYLFGQPEALSVLSIGCYRVESAVEHPLVGELLDRVRENPTRDVRELRVGPLPAEAARALAERHLGTGADEQGLADRVSREAGGSPFFVGELARFARRRGPSCLANLSFGDALADHVAQLPATARSILEIVALVGQPLPGAIVIEAACERDGHAALDLLRAEQLVRGTRSGGGVRRVECYHDRVRESVTLALPASRRIELYGALVRVLEPSPDADPELLARCYEGAGDRHRAARAAEIGADRAMSTSAFERASRLYEKAVELGDSNPDSRRGMRIKCADALVGAGRGPEAARVYRELANDSGEAGALELKRKAAYHLMTAGHVDEGRGLLVEVLASVGLGVPSSARRAKVRAVFSRVRLWLRGLALRRRRGPVPAGVARVLDVLWTVIQCLNGNDPFMVVDMVARYLRLSLDAGCEVHAARGLSYEAFVVSGDGIGAEARSSALAVRAEGMARRAADPEPLGFALLARGAVLMRLGRFRLARRHLAEALEVLQTRCRAVAFELALGRVFDQIAAYHLGEVREVAATAGALAEEAVRRGDIWEGAMLSTAHALPSWLAVDGPDQARMRLDRARRLRGVQSTYQRPDAALLLAEQRLLRFEGNAARAFTLVQEQWSALERADMLRAHVGRAEHHYERGCSAIAVLCRSPGDDRRARAVARSAARSLRRTRMAYAPAWAAMIDAALVRMDGSEDEAQTLLRSAVAILDDSEIALHAAAVRRRLGQLVGGQEGSELVSRGDATLRAQGVKNFEAMTEMLCPGFAGA
ncbi:MAG TPA: AAA family ATPase [Polyangiaceae bacterium]|nr:AAA family ATPase [Polyangiaceae bacterium]